MLFPRNNLPLVFIREMLISQYPSYVIVKQTKEMMCVYRSLDARGTDCASSGSKFKSRIILLKSIQNPTAATQGKVWLTGVRQARQDYKENYSIPRPDSQMMQNTDSTHLEGSMLTTRTCNAILISWVF